LLVLVAPHPLTVLVARQGVFFIHAILTRISILGNIGAQNNPVATCPKTPLGKEHTPNNLTKTDIPFLNSEKSASAGLGIYFSIALY
jgi:hypothetical protein